MRISQFEIEYFVVDPGRYNKARHDTQDKTKGAYNVKSISLMCKSEDLKQSRRRGQT